MKNNIMLEVQVERKLIARTKDLGFKAYKVSPLHGNAGMPDRLIVGPDTRVIWCETKRPKGMLEPLQKVRRDNLTKAGHIVFSVFDYEDIDTVCEYIKSVWLSD